MSVENGTCGYLLSCMDKRFVAPTREAFEKATGLGSTEYWHEALPGGAVAESRNPLGANYAYEHGARIMGWQAHGDSCGGQPGKTDEVLQKELDAVIIQAREKYPDATHYRIFATVAGISIEEI